jgi:hypothetical protein
MPYSSARPHVCILIRNNVFGYPSKGHDPDESGCDYAPLEDVLLEKYQTDAHLTQYAAPKTPLRLNTGAEKLIEGGVSLPLLIFDIDCPKSERVDGCAPESWWAVELEKVERLRAGEPGVLCWRTRGGYRLLAWLDEPHVVTDEASARAWSELYVLIGAHLSLKYGIVVDPRCRNWHRLMRAPLAVRDDGQREPGVFVGDPRAVGEWGLADLDVAAARAEVARLAEQPHGKAWAEALRAIDPTRGTAPTAPAPVTRTLLGELVDKLTADVVPAVARVTDGGGRHALYLALSGALLDRGVAPDDLPDLVELISRLAKVDDEKGVGDRRAGAQTTAARAKSGLTYSRIGELQRGWPEVARALDTALPKPGEATAKSWLATAKNNDEEEDEINAENWREYLATSDRGAILANEHNAVLAMKYAPEFAGHIRLDEFAKRINILGGPLKDTNLEHVSVEAAMILQSNKYGIPCGRETCWAALGYVGSKNGFHPLRDWLQSLQWDGVERVKELLRAFTAKDNMLNRAIFRRWMISAVARGIKPGCKVDTMLILVGEQGAFKSTAFATLASPRWFVDTPIDVRSGSKDAYMVLEGKWIIEWSELESLARSERTAVKAFLSSQNDSYRRPYAAISVDQPRGCVVVGSTNKPEFLNDPTGERRFWPVVTREGELVDIAWLERNREQLWAEAVHYYIAGERWWFDKRSPDDAELLEMLDDVHATHKELPSCYDGVSAWIKTRLPKPRLLGGNEPREPLPLTTANIVANALTPAEQRDKQAPWHVGACMRMLGYQSTQAYRGASRIWVLKTSDAAK